MAQQLARGDLNLDQIRADTPGCQSQVFLDSAGSSLPPDPVLNTVIEHLRREAEVGGYRAAAERVDDIAAVKNSLGALIGAEPTSIALSDSATRSWNTFFQSVPIHAGDRILITEVEYAGAAVEVLHRARRAGASVDVIPSDDSGRVDLDALERSLDERVRLVSLVHAPTNSGLINPVREVSELAHSHGALVLLDACQSVGQMSLDVAELRVDALSATGRKWLRGPRGTGFLYVRPDLNIEPAEIDHHGAEWTEPGSYRIADDASRFEFWEYDVAARLGLGAAADYLLALGMHAVEHAVQSRAERTRDLLTLIPGIQVRDPGYGDTASYNQPRSGIVSFTVDGIDSYRVREQLAVRGVTVTVSPSMSTLLDMSARALPSVVRASPHYFCSDDDLDAFAAAVHDVVRS
ncbi:MAG: aminotransferase class V-fold PLP-dependent enzyme [Rhodococcus sp.]|nr:aminotransferase class V-fold PLP-dependent enzyme [Rhodococcus sp. (in: high G+C Gram-positive bacteria)]